MRPQAAKQLGNILDNTQLTQQEIHHFLQQTITTPPTVGQILGYVDAMKQRMAPVTPINGAIDVCGTGGDGKGTFNISTCAALVLAAGNVPVIKHGNRAASGRFGSADLLEQLSVPIINNPASAHQFAIKHNFVFLFAQLYHPSLRRLALARKSFGKPTVFNLLGPLLNPASVQRQVIGTYSYKNAQLLAKIAQKLNHKHTLILASRDGLDEASPAATTDIFEIKGAALAHFTFDITKAGLAPALLSQCKAGNTPSQNAKIAVASLHPSPALSPRQRVLAYNAGMGFYVSGKAPTIPAGVDMAVHVIQSGRALQKLKELL